MSEATFVCNRCGGSFSSSVALRSHRHRRCGSKKIVVNDRTFTLEQRREADDIVFVCPCTKGRDKCRGAYKDVRVIGKHLATVILLVFIFDIRTFVCSIRQSSTIGPVHLSTIPIQLLWSRPTQLLWRRAKLRLIQGAKRIW